MSKEFNPVKKEKFTVPQALAVLLVFAILLALTGYLLNRSRAVGRDIKRLADVAMIQAALELYFQDCSVYPTELVAEQPLSAEACKGGVHLQEVPLDPSGAEYVYKACEGLESNRNCEPGVKYPTSYLLGYELENGVDKLEAGRYAVKP